MEITKNGDPYLIAISRRQYELLWIADGLLLSHTVASKVRRSTAALGWEPNPWTLGFVRARPIKSGFNERASWSLVWRRSGSEDWPPKSSLGQDHDWARKTGTGFVAEFGDEKLFLIDRDWFGWPGPPQWGLASYDRVRDKWQLWGNFDDVPSAWNSGPALLTKVS